ncbi:hypothetical protein [Nostoc sp.]|uniref:hypothetical protein n=1 Tax=Nostoc sp. TaxID=1180 RepID=UPI003FA61125
MPIAKQENWFVWEYNPVNQFSVLYFGHIERCHDKVTILQVAYYLVANSRT